MNEGSLMPLDFFIYGGLNMANKEKRKAKDKLKKAQKVLSDFSNELQKKSINGRSVKEDYKILKWLNRKIERNIEKQNVDNIHPDAYSEYINNRRIIFNNSKGLQSLSVIEKAINAINDEIRNLDGKTPKVTDDKERDFLCKRALNLAYIIEKRNKWLRKKENSYIFPYIKKELQDKKVNQNLIEKAYSRYTFRSLVTYILHYGRYVHRDKKVIDSEKFINNLIQESQFFENIDTNENQKELIQESQSNQMVDDKKFKEIEVEQSEAEQSVNYFDSNNPIEELRNQIIEGIIEELDDDIPIGILNNRIVKEDDSKLKIDTKDLLPYKIDYYKKKEEFFNNIYIDKNSFYDSINNIQEHKYNNFSKELFYRFNPKKEKNTIDKINANSSVKRKKTLFEIIKEAQEDNTPLLQLIKEKEMKKAVVKGSEALQNKPSVNYNVNEISTRKNETNDSKNKGEWKWKWIDPPSSPDNNSPLTGRPYGWNLVYKKVEETNDSTTVSNHELQQADNHIQISNPAPKGDINNSYLPGNFNPIHKSYN